LGEPTWLVSPSNSARTSSKMTTRPGLALERHDRDRIVGGDLVLFAAGANDCEHRFASRVHPGSTREARAAGFFAACNLLVLSARPRRADAAKQKRGLKKPRASAGRIVAGAGEVNRDAACSGDDQSP
jgi:hypothetical protein